jgi:hypothetical protein
MACTLGILLACVRSTPLTNESTQVDERLVKLDQVGVQQLYPDDLGSLSDLVLPGPCS